MPKRIHARATTLLSCLLAVVRLTAQGGAAANPLASVQSLTCSFPISTTAAWEKGEPQARLRTGLVLTFQYVDIDTAVSTARVVGLATEHNIVVQLSGANLHFLEIRSNGGLMLTTVFNQESRDKKLKAVHTRADYQPIDIPGFVTPPAVSQHYGECEIAK